MANKSTQLIYFISKLCQYLFEVSFVSFVFFFFLEYFKEGIVTNYFNFNLFLIFTLVFGIITILLPRFEIEGKKKRRTLVTVLAAILSGIAVYQVLPDSLEVYYFIPWVVGIAVWAGIRILKL